MKSAHICRQQSQLIGMLYGIQQQQQQQKNNYVAGVFCVWFRRRYNFIKRKNSGSMVNHWQGSIDTLFFILPPSIHTPLPLITPPPFPFMAQHNISRYTIGKLMSNHQAAKCQLKCDGDVYRPC